MEPASFTYLTIWIHWYGRGNYRNDTGRLWPCLKYDRKGWRWASSRCVGKWTLSSLAMLIGVMRFVIHHLRKSVTPLRKLNYRRAKGRFLFFTVDYTGAKSVHFHGTFSVQCEEQKMTFKNYTNSPHWIINCKVGKQLSQFAAKSLEEK